MLLFISVKYNIDDTVSCNRFARGCSCFKTALDQTCFSVCVWGGVGGREVVRSVPAKVAPSDVGARRYSPVTMGTPAIGSQLPCCPVKILSVQHENRLNLYV